MRLDLSVSKSVIIHAGTDKVWDVLTNPEIIKEYLFGTQTVTDWKVGNEVVFQGEYKGHKYRDHGIVLENIRGQKLSYTYWSGFSGLPDEPGNYSVVTCTLVRKGDQETEFTWAQKGFSTVEAHQHSESGMDAFLQSIKVLAER